MLTNLHNSTEMELAQTIYLKLEFFLSIIYLLISFNSFDWIFFPRFKDFLQSEKIILLPLDSIIALLSNRGEYSISLALTLKSQQIDSLDVKI